ncbi:hypothetical protein GCM10012275_57450 [Longimycelium tulufanense]|uniref:TraD/TraG TraM recognition site domain-containing protein n=1 Tax=Longimycelium tulufanense TaxID=907463 RepID=A0A8J3CHT1_9PSEU|nr:type IV secretory system conjugative DNA transfer family protein [Longimycelium tulufanense]GGM79375.1 hypothetical protein GCM10012275_57450 [Longimycelium tulufanense]
MSAVEDRPVHGRVPSSHDLGLLAVAVVVALTVVTVVAGQLAAVVTGRGWPSWSGVSPTALWAPILGVYVHAGDPLRDWPGLGADRPGPVAYWLVFTLLLTLLLTLAVWVVRRRLRARSRPGFASGDEVAARLGTAALLRQAPRLRPGLVATTPRPTPTQLGMYLGRDVTTGVDTWSSVRQSTYVVGPSESGKTSCVVIPTALDHDGPLLAPSARPDVMAATWQARADRGPVRLFDPLRRSPGLPLLRWDPVRGCENPVVAMRRAEQLIVGVDMSRVTDGDTWRAKGEAVLRNLLHAAALRHKDVRTVLEWIYDPTSEEPYAILRNASVTPDSWAQEQRRVSVAPDRQQAGIYMSVETATKMFNDPRVLDTCTPRHDHFEPAEFVEAGDATLYLLSELDAGTSVAGLLAALMAEILEAAKDKSGKQANARLDPPLRLLADEAPNTATLRSMPYLISAGGGQGIPTTMIVQERAQARKVWGDDDEASMWGGATMRLILPGIADADQLREIASYVDEYDVETRSQSRGQGGVSTQTSVRTLPGLTPARVRALSPWHALVIAGGGLRPVETELTPYFRRDDSKATTDAERAYYEAVRAGRSVL